MDIVKPDVARPQSVLSRPVPRGLSEPELLQELRQRARAVQASGRAAEVLYGLAMDIFGDDGNLPPAERRWLMDALKLPVGEAAYEAVETLLRELADVLGATPRPLRPVLARGPVSRIDFE